jgi:hypothetical protein
MVTSEEMQAAIKEQTQKLSPRLMPEQRGEMAAELYDSLREADEDGEI